MRSPFYTAEHEAWRAVMRRFVENEIEPHAHEWDEAGETPRELYVKAAAIGFLRLGFPQEKWRNPPRHFATRAAAFVFRALASPEEWGAPPADQFMKIVTSQELARAGAGGINA